MFRPAIQLLCFVGTKAFVSIYLPEIGVERKWGSQAITITTKLDDFDDDGRYKKALKRLLCVWGLKLAQTVINLASVINCPLSKKHIGLPGVPTGVHFRGTTRRRLDYDFFLDNVYSEQSFPMTMPPW